jgi:hypothetical protein
VDAGYQMTAVIPAKVTKMTRPIHEKSDAGETRFQGG